LDSKGLKEDRDPAGGRPPWDELGESLIKLDPTDEDFEDLRKILEDKHRQGLTVLVTGETPKEWKRRRKARGGTIVQYVPGSYFDAMANAIFHHLWSFEVEDHHIGDNQIWVKGKVTIRVPRKHVKRTLPDGTVEEIFTEGLEVSKTQFGGSDIKRVKDSTKVIDIGDDLKAAATDAKKKCFVSFGFMADVYSAREEVEELSGESAAASGQIDALKMRAEEKGLNEDDLNDWVKSNFEGKELKDLTSDEAITAIQGLMKG
jgi:recombination DNA repair RAD52 pathway protein